METELNARAKSDFTPVESNDSAVTTVQASAHPDGEAYSSDKPCYLTLTTENSVSLELFVPDDCNEAVKAIVVGVRGFYANSPIEFRKQDQPGGDLESNE